MLLGVVSLGFCVGIGVASATTIRQDPFYQNAINSFYKQRNSKSFWVAGKKLSVAGETLWKVLSSSWENGLNPNSYHVKEFFAEMKPQTTTYQRLKQEMRNIKKSNNTNSEKVKYKQVVVNMERLRWISDKKPDRFIVVNIPSERLWAVKNSAVRFTMPVVVGSVNRPIIPFVTKIYGVRFNPTWTILQTIKKEDIWPHLRKNSNYLIDKGVELFSGYDKNAITVDSTTIDWENISTKDLLSFNMVQMPGKNNPLGSIHIIMPNKYNIYLHDTNNKEAFYKSNRAVSYRLYSYERSKKSSTFCIGKRAKR